LPCDGLIADALPVKREGGDTSVGRGVIPGNLIPNR